MAKEIGDWSKQRPAGRRHADSAPSDTLVRHLKPGERLIWTARGRGHTNNRPAPGIASGEDLLALMVLTVMLVVLVPGAISFPESVGGLRMIALVACVLVLAGLVLRSVFGHSLEIYGLTKERLIVFHTLFRTTASYTNANIHFLRVEGDAKRGDVVFRNRVLDWLPFRWSERGMALVGIDDPERVANLIETTLSPGLRVEDGRDRAPQ